MKQTAQLKRLKKRLKSVDYYTNIVNSIKNSLEIELAKDEFVAFRFTTKCEMETLITKNEHLLNLAKESFNKACMSVEHFKTK